MDRRVFFRILSATSAGALSTGCGTNVGKLMPLLVPEREIVPGEEQWHPSVCTACSAGCGTRVRIMEGERVTTDNGEQVRERVAAIKNIEGNPLDPISGGRLCARGQASVQALYHPDRLRNPMDEDAEQLDIFLNSLRRRSWASLIFSRGYAREPRAGHRHHRARLGR